MAWTIPKLKRRIEQCEATIERTEKILNSPFQAVGAFVTGRSNRPASLERAVTNENNRRMKAYRQWKKAKDNLRFYEARLSAIELGEVHPNGQPRADAPSRKKRERINAKIADVLRWHIKKGDRVALAMNPRNTITVKRVNKKSVTSMSDVRYTYDELCLTVNGAVATDEQVREIVERYLEEAK